MLPSLNSSTFKDFNTCSSYITVAVLLCKPSTLAHWFDYFHTDPTCSCISGSEADASQRLFRMKMFGFDSFMLTLWKKFFSCGQNRNVNYVIIIIIQKTAMVSNPQKIHWCIKTKSNPFKIPSQQQVDEKSRALTLGLNSETIHKFPQVS